MIENTPGIAHIGLAKAKGFHLGAFQYKPCFIFMKQVVFMTDFSIENLQRCKIERAKLRISFEFRVSSDEFRVTRVFLINDYSGKGYFQTE